MNYIPIKIGDIQDIIFSVRTIVNCTFYHLGDVYFGFLLSYMLLQGIKLCCQYFLLAFIGNAHFATNLVNNPSLLATNLTQGNLVNQISWNAMWDSYNFHLKHLLCVSNCTKGAWICLRLMIRTMLEDEDAMWRLPKEDNKMWTIFWGKRIWKWCCILNLKGDTN